MQAAPAWSTFRTNGKPGLQTGSVAGLPGKNISSFPPKWFLSSPQSGRGIAFFLKLIMMVE
jgi:hypothetical protein